MKSLILFIFSFSIYANQLTISGISSGGFMANQMATIYSSQFDGVGTVAGGYYYCAEDYLPKKIEQDKNTIGTLNLFFFEPTTKVITDTLNPFMIINGAKPNTWFRPSATNPIYQSVSICMGDPKKGKLPRDYYFKNIQENLVDSNLNFSKQRAFIYHGKVDSVLQIKMIDRMKEFYKMVGVKTENIKVSVGEGSHNFPTDKEGQIECGEESVPYVASCKLDIAKDILEYLTQTKLEKANPELNHIYKIDQTVEAKNIIKNETEWEQPVYSVASYGYMYANDFCLNNPGECKVHVALHGCKMSDSYNEEFQTNYQNQVVNLKVLNVNKKDDSIPALDIFGFGLKYLTIEEKINQLGLLKFVKDSGYIDYAEKNNLIIVFPQTWITEKNFPYNPKGCWDWFGFTNADYATNKGIEASWLMSWLNQIVKNPSKYILNSRPDFETVDRNFPVKK